MAFTKRGKRLGHGMGYYDRFLSSYSSKYGRSPTTIGLSLSTQIVEDLPQVKIFRLPFIFSVEFYLGSK